MTEITPREAKRIAEEAYIFAYPMLENYKTMFVVAVFEGSPVYEAPFNQLTHKSTLLGPEYTVIVRPNNDTFYSSVWMDLRAEPIVIQVPAIQDQRYYSFQLIDLYTHNFGYIGTRETGFDAGTYMIAGPNWEGVQPEGVLKVFTCEGNLAAALVRTQVYGHDDIDAVMALQKEFQATPLSQFLGKEAPPAPPVLDFPIWNPEQVKSAGFINYLNFLMGQLELHPSETELFERFSKIGIEPGKTFDLDNLQPEILAAINAGVASALQKIVEKTKSLGEYQNNWMLVSGIFGSRDLMAGKYLTRAAAAYFGLYGNDLEEAFYPDCTLDGNGDALDASKHNYVLHFEADQIPPVKGFWSFSMYKLPEQHFIFNPINRYVISSTTEGLQYGEDGSLTLYLQHESPGPSAESNWLPAPDGLFSLQARFYWPEPKALDPLYAPPPVKKA